MSMPSLLFDEVALMWPDEGGEDGPEGVED